MVEDLKPSYKKQYFYEGRINMFVGSEIKDYFRALSSKKGMSMTELFIFLLNKERKKILLENKKKK